MIVQMIIDVVDEDREGDSAPELLDIHLGVCSMLTDCIDDLRVGMFGRLANVHAEQCCRRDVHESAPGVPVTLIRRFDRPAGGRLMYVSAATLLGVDVGEPTEHTYTEIVDVIRWGRRPGGYRGALAPNCLLYPHQQR